MRFLLDTHTFLWLVSDSPELSSQAREWMVDPNSELMLSSVVATELAIKTGIGKLRLARPVSEFVDLYASEYGLTHWPLNFEEAARLENLPLHHRDPFDRLLIAQAIHHDVPILTRDPVFKQYACEIRWD